jgi:hypothetical protein
MKRSRRSQRVLPSDGGGTGATQRRGERDGPRMCKMLTTSEWTRVSENVAGLQTIDWLRLTDRSPRNGPCFVPGTDYAIGLGEENNMRRLVALALALSLVKPLRCRHRSRSRRRSRPTHVTVVFIDTQREAARSYARATRPRQLPPGLAKKNNRCLPPGQAKALRRWPPLPHGVV